MKHICIAGMFVSSLLAGGALLAQAADQPAQPNGTESTTTTKNKTTDMQTQTTEQQKDIGSDTKAPASPDTLTPSDQQQPDMKAPAPSSEHTTTESTTTTTEEHKDMG